VRPTVVGCTPSALLQLGFRNFMLGFHGAISSLAA
jgi:hypothetical protein